MHQASNPLPVCLHGQFTRIRNGDLRLGLAAVGSLCFNLVHEVHTINNLAEDGVLSIQPLSLDGSDEELATVGVLASVGHGEDTRPSVLAQKVLVFELGSVNGLTASSITPGEITSLKHEVGDDSVEDGVLVVKRLALIAHALLAGAQGAEVLYRLGNSVAVKTHSNPAFWLVVNQDVEVDRARDGLIELLLALCLNNRCQRQSGNDHKETERERLAEVHD
mmetsp:Transcript_7958/g.9232  ORF Transcript_7958/g.9232 Transcript_7958/m.9232 type:complete len:221 (-) Transcript_7958:115-777(-)